MSAFSPMSYGRRKTGAVNTALFVKRKRKAISALAEYERADGVLKAAKAVGIGFVDGDIELVYLDGKII